MASITDPFGERDKSVAPSDAKSSSNTSKPSITNPFPQPTRPSITNPFPELSTAPSSPSAVVNDSSLPVDPPSADLATPLVPPQATSIASIEQEEAMKQAELSTAMRDAEIAAQPYTTEMPSVFYPDIQNMTPEDLERVRVEEILKQTGPTVDKANVNLNPSVSGITGVPGNYQMNIGIGDVPVDDATATDQIVRGNLFEMPNNAFVRGLGRVENVVNIFGQQLGLRDTETFINKFQELNRIYPDAPKEIQDGLRAITEAETWSDVYKAMKENPGAILSVAGESLPQMIPGLIAATGATITGGPLAGAAALGTSSGAIEFGNVLDEEIRASGIDLNDSDALEALMGDAEFWARARDRGARRGVPIALFDALSMGIAGKLVGFTRARTSSIPATAAAATGELAAQGGLGSIGETAAQLAERQGGYRDRLNLGEIALEGVAEFVPGSVEATIQTLSRDATTVEAQQAIQELEKLDLSEANFNAAMEALTPQPMSFEDEIRDLAARMRAIGEDGQAEAYLTWLNRKDQVRPRTLPFLRERVVEFERRAAGLEPLKPRDENVFERFVVQNEREREQYEAAMNDPRTRPFMEQMAKEMQMLSDRMYELGYHIDDIPKRMNRMPPEIQKAYSFFSNGGSAMRIIKKLNSNLKGYKGRLQVTDEDLVREITRMEQVVGRNPMPQIGNTPTNPTVSQSLPQPNTPAVDDAPVRPTVNSQTVEQPAVPVAPVQPSAPSSDIVTPEQPKPAQAQTETPTQPEAPKTTTPPTVQEQPSAPTVPDQPAALPNPQEAEEVGTDVDNVVKTVQTPDGQKNYNVKGKVVELADLKAAQGELQPRDRSRKESDALAKERAGTMFNPARLLDDPTSGSGAPIIARDGTVMSGNGRVLTMQEVYANQPDSLARYQEALKEAGINTEGFSQPVFVRQLTDDMDMAQLREFADLSNSEAQAQMSMTERAGRDAKRLTDSGIIDLYRGDFDIGAAQNREFVQEYAKKILSPTEQGAFVDSKGVVSQEGISRVRNAILASAFDNPDTLATMLESSDENIKAISNAFMATAPKFAQLKKQIADGRTDAQFDITPTLAEMANLVSRLRRDNVKLQDYYNQSEMFELPDADVKELVKAFYNENLTRANSTKAMKDFLTFYADEALQKESGGLIPDETTASDIIEAGRQRTKEKRDAGQGKQTGLDFQVSSNVKRNDARGEQVQERRNATSRKRVQKESNVEAQERVNETTQDAPQGAVEGVAELGETASVTPDKAETREDNTRGTKAGRVTIATSETLRQSLYRSAFRDAGLDPDQAVNMSEQRKYRVISDMVKKKYGLNSIEVPRQGVGYDQVNALLDAYHNLQWMTHTLGMPTQAIGLDGSLTLALPQRAWGGYLAAYAHKKLGPSNFQSDINEVTGPVILMPRRSNSFAHEWGHALDYHIMDKLGADWSRGMTGRIRGNLEKGESVWIDGAPNGLVEAMGDLMNAMFYDNAVVASEIMLLESEISRLQAKQDRRKSGKPIKKLADLQRQLTKLREGSSKKRMQKSQYRKDVTNFTQRNNENENYWARPTEMFARAFEAYVARNVEAAGGYNEFITQGNEAYALTIDKVKGADDRLALTYPNDEERMAIFLAMDRVMDELRAEVITEGTPAQAPGDLDMIDAQALFMENLDISKQESVSLIEDQRRTYRAHVAQRERIKNRPKEFNNVWEMFQDSVGVNLIYSKRGYLYTLANRHKDNPKAKRLIESIIARLAPDPGSTDDRVTVEGGAFEEAVRKASRRYSGVLGDLIKKHRLEEYTERQMRELRLYLTSDETTQLRAGEEVKRAAGDLRNRLLNPLYDYMRKNGLDVNYLPDGAYMPRMMDAILVIANKEDFLYGGNHSKRGAKPLYSEVIYENEYGALDTTDIEQARELINLGRREKIASLLKDEQKKQINELRKLLDKAEEADSKADDPNVDAGEVAAELAQTQEQIDEVHAEVYEMLRDPYGEVAAQDWYNRITARSVGDISRHGVQGDFAKKRKLPPEADVYMVEFYLNPLEAMMQYVPGVVRKTEYEKRFGTKNVPKGQRRKTSGTSFNQEANVHDYMSWASEQMAMAGMQQREIREIQHIVETVTGTGMRYDGSGTRLINTIHSYGTMTLLPKAVIASVVEPMVASMQTGKVRDSFRLFGYMIDEAFTSIRGEDARRRKQYYRQLASVLGVVDLPEVGQMIANRVGGTTEEDSKSAARVGRFFVNTYLVALTNSQRRGAMRIGIQYISEIGKQYKHAETGNERERAREVLQDLGVRPDDMEQFADYVASLEEDGAGLYDIEMVLDRSGELTDMGEILATAVLRFDDSVVQDPKVIDRPKWAEHPIGRIVFGIQSFIAAHTRNVIIATGKRIQREYQKRGVNAAIGHTAMKVALPLTGLMLSHAIVTGLREALLNPEKWEEEKENDNLERYLLEMTLTRSGAFGRLDPLYNAMTSLKYQSDLTNLLAGASGSYYAKGAQRMLTPFIRNSENTVAAEYQAARGAYDILVPTALSYVASDPRLGRVLGPAGGLAAAAASTPAVKHWVLRNIIYQMYKEEYRPSRGNRQKKKSSSSFIFPSN